MNVHRINWILKLYVWKETWKKLDYSNIVKIVNSNKIKELIKINNINYLKNNNYKNFQKKFNEIINIKN